jgi:hypothetical protein
MCFDVRGPAVSESLAFVAAERGVCVEKQTIFHHREPISTVRAGSHVYRLAAVADQPDLLWSHQPGAVL